MLSRIIKWMFIAGIFMGVAGISTYLTIHLLIRSEQIVVVPDLAGKEVVYALELLSDLELNTKVKASQYSQTIARRHVISQDPAPGSEIKKGRDVRLVISKGPRAVVIPNLTSTPLAQVRIYLAENGLHQGVVSYTHSDKQPKQTVLAQYPLPGATAMRGDAVDLLVSDGPPDELMVMADLTAMGLDQAVKAIEQRQLRVEAIEYTQKPGLPNDAVISHNPASGYPVTVGTNVELTINRRQKGKRFPARPAVVLFRHRTDPGWLRTHIRISINRPQWSMDMYDSYVKPRQDIWLIIPGEEASATGLPTTLLLYADDDLIRTEHFD